VLPIGGVKEKVLAAHRAGIKTFILPRRNMQDLQDVPPEVAQDLRFLPVERMDEVLAIALHPLPLSAEELERPEHIPAPIKPIRLKRPPAPRPATHSAGPA
jgi:ATP-dependent Lon protease